MCFDVFFETCFINFAALFFHAFVPTVWYDMFFFFYKFHKFFEMNAHDTGVGILFLLHYFFPKTCDGSKNIARLIFRVINTLLLLSGGY